MGFFLDNMKTPEYTNSYWSCDLYQGGSFINVMFDSKINENAGYVRVNLMQWEPKMMILYVLTLFLKWNSRS